MSGKHGVRAWRARTGWLGTASAPSPLRYLARALRRYPAHIREHLEDSWHFFRWSASVGERSARNLRGRITESSHNIEKGLSLPHPRPRFGAAAIARLLGFCNDHIDRFGMDERALGAARDVLAAYRDWHLREGVDDFPHRDGIEAYLGRMKEAGGAQRGGLRQVTRKEIMAAVGPVSLDFFKTRHSVRQFSGEPVDLALIDAAIEAALKAPAVCNRQYARTVVVADRGLVAEVLERQGGARGFAGGVDKVIVVTTRLSHFWGAGERNQPWVDGGLFAMVLLLALHAQGLGACALNWSKTNAQTREMRRFLDLDGDEVIIMMIAVGHLREAFEVAFSDRVPASASTRVLAPGHR